MKGLLALALAYVFSQFYRSFLAVLAPQLSTEIGADKADLSLAAGVWFISFALMQFVVGVSLDRYGPRRTAGVLFGVAATAGALLFARAQSPLAIVVGMGLIGVGCSPVLMGSLFIFARRFEARQFAVMTSWLVAFGNLGNVVGASPLAQAIDAFGWRSVMTGLAFISLGVSAAILLWVRDPEPQSTHQAGVSGYLTLLKTPALWPIMIMVLLCYAPVAGIRGLWSGPYLAEIHQADSLLIGNVTLWMALAMILGSLVYGPLDKFFNTRKWVVFGGNAVVLLALLVLTYKPDIAFLAATVLFILIGLCGTSYGVVMAHGRAFVPPELMGRGVTLLNFCSIFGAGVMQFLSGRVIEQGAAGGTLQSWQWLYASYALPLAVALAIYLVSKDAKPGRVGG